MVRHSRAPGDHRRRFERDLRRSARRRTAADAAAGSFRGATGARGRDAWFCTAPVDAGLFADDVCTGGVSASDPGTCAPRGCGHSSFHDDADADAGACGSDGRSRRPV